MEFTITLTSEEGVVYTSKRRVTADFVAIHLEKPEEIEKVLIRQASEGAMRCMYDFIQDCKRGNWFKRLSRNTANGLDKAKFKLEE